MQTTPRKILVVEDYDGTRELIADILEQEGYEVLEAPDGQEALMLALQHTPDLIILDIQLPRLDGFEICRMLRANHLTEATPIIMSSAGIHSQEQALSIEAGANDYIGKPFDIKDLVALINQYT